ncbi:hypothetical protein BAZO_10503 [Schinkia azotoformans LMG 9581]|uniref:Transposase n=1 Tax=Schinkia azotoformans LMG 9581 TaxID=1131731 RepID=K6E1P5_SCHAZ|nr:hypothetical protein BAZO_10503 [Schinkia azotoformans LMG 9581]
MGQKGNCYDNAPMESFWANPSNNGLMASFSKHATKCVRLYFGILNPTTTAKKLYAVNSYMMSEEIVTQSKK